ncbi:ABC transporter ATP-binding protein [Sulfitobacter alexandrii]|uniref:ABC transporter ATP-binding protein n=2 Tax=Sulfitobacter alexandrii TaxID=1917485 RepID=A0A1J0WIC6_9RHOB|nr:ABC transporter ATP-binding protein [Sulfitobacter alexandrii]APE43936.1 ABC transporter ATP-binding protein [Sulfitobacter alexandrii]
MTGPFLSAERIHLDYGQIKVLKDVSLTLEEGERHVIIGPNGAGKTTLFKVLSGELRPTAGRIVMEGDDISRTAGYQRVRRGVGRSFQVARVFHEMTALDNVAVAVEARQSFEGRKPGFWRISATPEVIGEATRMLDELGLANLRDTPASAISHGDRKRLELAMSLALRPRILMLDEPTAGMSPTDRTAAVKLIDRIIRENGISLILTEHDMGVVFQLGTRLSVLNYGELVVSGTPEEVRRNPMVREIYLGRNAHA